MKKEEGKSSRYMFELRNRLIAVVVFFILTLIIGLLFAKKLVLLFLNLNLPENINLVTLTPSENISLFMHFAFFISIALTIPFIIYHIIKFIKPGLEKNEGKAIVIIPFISLFLFIIGALFGFLLTKDIIVPFLSKLTTDIGVLNNWSINKFMGFVIYLSMAIGFVFQMPLVLSLLVRYNLLKSKQIKKARKFSILILICFAAIITPPDIFSLIIVVLPLLLLFELTIFITKFIKPREKK